MCHPIIAFVGDTGYGVARHELMSLRPDPMGAFLASNQACKTLVAPPPPSRPSPGSTVLAHGWCREAWIHARSSCGFWPSSTSCPPGAQETSSPLQGHSCWRGGCLLAVHDGKDHQRQQGQPDGGHHQPLQRMCSLMTRMT